MRYCAVELGDLNGSSMEKLLDYVIAGVHTAQQADFEDKIHLL